MMRTGVRSSPFDEHLKYFDPATAIPLRVFFFEDVDCATCVSPCNCAHVLDDLVTLACGGFETFPVENDDFATVVTDQIALAQITGGFGNANPPHTQHICTVSYTHLTLP